MVVFFLPAFLVNLYLPEVFQSTATVVIDKEMKISPLTGERRDFESDYLESFTFNTHFHLISSRPVLEMVIEDLDLDALDPETEIATSAKWMIRNRIRKFFGKTGEKPASSPEKEMDKRLGILKNNIHIEKVRNTRILLIHVTAKDKSLARDIANSLAENYILFNNKDRKNDFSQTMDRIRTEMDETRKALEEAELGFLEYKEKEKIFSAREKHRLILSKIDEFNNAYIRTRNERLELEEKLKLLSAYQDQKKTTLSLYIRSLLASPSIDRIYDELLALEIEKSRLSEVFKEKHPTRIQVESKITKVRQKLETEIKKELTNLKARKTVLLAREKVLENTLEDVEEEALNLNRKELMYMILERKVDTSRKMYDILLSKLKEVDATRNINISNIRLKAPAPLPVSPAKPARLRNILLFSLLGLVTGISIVMTREYMDHSLRTEKEVERSLGLSVVSHIPEKRTLVTKPHAIPMFLENHPPTSDFSISYRILKSNMGLHLHEGSIRIIAVTSATPGEGRTTTAANLAARLSAENRSVLLMDLDFATQDLMRFVPHTLPGGMVQLFDYCTGVIKNNTPQEEAETGFIRLLGESVHPVKPNLDIMPSGISPDAAKEITNDQVFARMMNMLKNRYEYIVMDIPPVFPESGVPLFASLHADGMLFVISAGKAHRYRVKKSLAILSKIPPKHMWTVLNRADIPEDDANRFSA